MAPDLGEWVVVSFLRETHGLSTCPAQFLLTFPENPERIEEPCRPLLPNYQEQAQARSWHGRHWPGLHVVNTAETRLANMAFYRFLSALR